MAEKILNTRIQNRIDSLENWLAAEAAAGATGLVLKKGEIAVVTISEKDENGFPTGVPSVLVKVGDGVHTFSSLEYIYAKAADVHAWAKASSKPTYAATEITGLDTFIGNTIQDTNTTYKLEKDSNNPRIIRLYYQEKGSTEWAVASELELENCSALITEAINGLDATVSSAEVEEGKGVQVTVVETDGKLTSVSVAGNYDNAYDAKGAAATAEANAIAHANSEIAKTNANVTTNTNAISAINTALEGKASATDLATLKGRVDGHDTEISGIKEAATTLTGRVDGHDTAINDIKTKTGVDSWTETDSMATVLKGVKTLAEATDAELDAYKESNDAAVALLATKAELEAETTAREEAEAAINERIDGISTDLEGYATKEEVALKADKTALDEEIARAKAAEEQALTDAKAYTDEVKEAILGEGIKDTFDTLVEIQNWIEGDGVNATELTEAIAAEAKTRGDADAAFETRIAALEGIDYATKAEVEQAKTDAATDATTKANAAEANAKGHADSLNTAMDGRVAKLEAIDHSLYAVKTQVEADINTALGTAAADATSKANAAEANAKAYADGLATNYDAAGSAAQALEDAKDYTDTEVAKVAGVANTAVQEVTASEGLKATRAEGSNTVNIAIDDTVTFVFNCGDAAGNPIA